MANENNLIPNSERTPEELREQTKKAGIKSGEVRRRNKLVRETAVKMAEGKLGKAYIEVLKANGIDESILKDATVIEAMVIRMMDLVLMGGNVQAFNSLCDRIDGKPEQAITDGEGEALAPPVINVYPMQQKEREE
jgi:hypothetical protein